MCVVQATWEAEVNMGNTERPPPQIKKTTVLLEVDGVCLKSQNLAEG
jgi:hypothetical protein